MITKKTFFIISNIVGGWFFELKNGEKKSLKKAMIWRINVILTNDELIFSKAVLRNFQVERSRSLTDTTRDIVVRTVAWAVPTTVVTRFTDWDTTQVSADTKHDEPLGLLHTLSIRLGVTELINAN